MSRISLTYSQERCVRLAGKLMQQGGMLHPGARVGVAVSGGMDSFVLLKVLQIRQRIVPFDFSFTALHVNPGFTPGNHAPLTAWLEANGINGHLEESDHGPRAHSEENRKRSACFYCAMLRRKRLFELCRDLGLTHLAFGHNADDLVSSFFLNLCQTGRVEGMSMREDFFRGELTVIRPLMLVEKKLIRKAARDWELPLWDNPCPSAGATRRSDVMADLDTLCAGHRERRKNIFNGLIRWQFEKTVSVEKPVSVPDEKSTSAPEEKTQKQPEG